MLSILPFPKKDYYRLLGNCPFEKSEKRAAMKAPSFEKFRFFSKLNHIEIPQVDRDGLISSRRLFPEELLGIAELLTTPKKKFTYKDLRKFLRLDENLSFGGVPFKEEGKKEIALSSNKSEGSFSGSYALYQILGTEIWAALHQSAKKLRTLDDCAEILSFFASPENMAKEFKKRHIPEEIYTPLLDAVENGKFNDFTKAANLSTKACRKILPFLLEGKVYSEACEMAHYNHAAASRDHWSQIRTHKDFVQLIKDFTEGQDRIANPSARKALTEGLKQLWAMQNKFGLPGKIAIELAREVGKSADERGKLKTSLDQTTAERKLERKEAADALGIEEYQVSSENLLRYRLWKEQKGFCLYSGKAIPAGQFHSPEFEVDHILPKSRSFDNSFNNKTLACLSENRKKGNLTPYEYFNAAKLPEEWYRFQESVEQISRKGSKCGIKKKNYLTKTLQEGLTERHLNDTRYASRLMAQCAELFYDKKDRQRSKGGEKRVFTRPGALTAALRQGWGVEHLKKEKEKNPKTGRRERIPDDRHHALDAICVACVDEKEILKIQKSFQENEKRTNDDRNLRKSPLPWDRFPEDVKVALDKIIVARPENRRARGEGHKETIRRFKISEKTETLSVSSRKSLKGLKTAEVQKLVGRLKDPERNPHIKAALETWISQGCPPDTLPRSPKGDEIRRIVVKEDQKSGIPLKTGRGEKSRKGLVAAASITRLDVFSKQKTSGKNKGEKEFYLVPIYSWQIMQNILPHHACIQGKNEKDWIFMDESKGFTFEFTLYPGSYVKIIRKGEMIEGYYASFGRATAQIVLKNPNNPQELYRSIGVKNLPLFEKYHIDRFGQLYKAGKESR
ncbi:type II CRISPR RNA-guided endonuclease Cas9 [Acetobacteraceae bacterium]|nr:type II CRISPR RNA-guided endonuclease Cas9 [Acetobacteraceae bacterium]